MDQGWGVRKQGFETHGFPGRREGSSQDPRVGRAVWRELVGVLAAPLPHPSGL